MKYILASASPRRRELLKTFIDSFVIKAPQTDETFNPGQTPENNLLRVSRAKALTAAEKGCVIIAADTVVVKDGFILTKPSNRDEAFDMLCLLNNSAHTVMTAVSVISDFVEFGFVEKTKVIFRNTSQHLINDYINTKEPLDKAGAYGIQGLGAFLVKRIQGDYANVVGLPVSELVNRLIAHDLYELPGSTLV